MYFLFAIIIINQALREEGDEQFAKFRVTPIYSQP